MLKQERALERPYLLPATGKDISRRDCIQLLLMVAGSLAWYGLNNRNRIRWTINNFSFASELGKQGGYRGPLAFQILEYEGSSLFPAWTEDEKTVLAEQIIQAKEFLFDKFGPPKPWTKNLKVLFIKTSRSLAIPEWASASYGRNSSFLEKASEDLENLRAILIYENLQPFSFAEIIVHEMKHAWTDDKLGGGLPSFWCEGQAELARFLYLGEKQGKVFQEKALNDEKNKNFLGYLKAGILWVDWYNKHPEFFLKLGELENKFYSHFERRPTWEETVSLGVAVEPDFKTWLERNMW